MVQRITAAEAIRKKEAGVPIVFVDVRRADEHEYCHIEGSVWIPLDELPHRIEEIEVPEGASVVVYCHHGVRSLSGASILMQNGFDEVFSLTGGIEAWSLEVDPSVPRY